MKSLVSMVTGDSPEPKKVVKNDAVQITPQQNDLELALVEGIDAAIASDINPRFVKWGGFHPSTTNMCARYHVYLYRGVEQQQDHSARVQRIFDNGHAMHERVGGYLDKMGILLEQEFPLKHDDPPIEGTCDGIIEWDGRKLIELKSISEAGFIYRELYHKPKDDHYRQAQIYMKCLDLEKGFVIYENKNNQKILPLLVERNDEFIDKLFTKLRKAYKAFEDGKTPVRPYKSPSSQQCQQCQLRTLCWSDIEGEKI